MRLLFTLFLITLGINAATAQPVIYEQENYDYTVTDSIIYGFNVTVLPVLAGGEPTPRPLFMDIYQPVDAEDQDRPLVFVYHTGNFLPFPTNGGTGGTIRDSTVVQACRTLAKRGFVAVSVDYRLGWNPIAETQDERVNTLINAAYRGVQDARSCIRWFKKNARDGGNTYQVDTTRIVSWGIGTGGYITAASATLDAYNDILLPKFLQDDGNGGIIPMVIEGVHGDIYGTSFGINPLSGDTLCLPNIPTYDDGSLIGSDFQLAVNMGGALGDSSWLDNTDVPWVSFHNINDPFAPYMEGIVLVPVVLLPVVEVQGSYIIQMLANQYGLNNVFANATFNEEQQAVTDVANSRNNGYDGLYPFPGDDSAPWDFWSFDNIGNQTDPSLMYTPEQTELRRDSALIVWDTVMNYFIPRACATLGLDCQEVVSTKELIDDQKVGLNLAPNPSSDEVRIVSNPEYPMLGIELHDSQGRLIKSIGTIQNNQYILQKGNLIPGIYYAKIAFEEGLVVKKIVFN